MGGSMLGYHVGLALAGYLASVSVIPPCTKPVLEAAMTSFTTYIIQAIRRLTVVIAAATIILAYIALLNLFGGLFGAGKGWDNPLRWFASAVSALIVVFAASWLLTRTGKWLSLRFNKSDSTDKE